MVELEGIGMEMEKLLELESIKEEWQLQASAQDEVGWQQQVHSSTASVSSKNLISSLCSTLFLSFCEVS
jgi:hypothetical protein